MKSIVEKVGVAYRVACTKLVLLAKRNAEALMLVSGGALLLGGLCSMSSAQVITFSEAQYHDTLVRYSVGNLFKLVEGSFGALIMVVAGLGAIIAAAMGAYRAAVGMLVVAVGAFILRALVSLFFGTNFAEFGGLHTDG